MVAPMENELQKTFLDTTDIPDIQTYFVNQAFEFQELMMMYSCAIREMRTKLEVLNDELSIHHKRNPIEFITSRVKKPLSIVEKLHRYGVPVSVESVEQNLNDVAGVRVICSFIDDIYTVADMLLRQDDITLIKKKDYIEHPKDNGYRSLHLIVEIPVFFSNQKKNIRVEVQIRTIAMDFWASVDHQLKYKQDIDDLENADELSEELRNCADIIAQTDRRMQAIKDKIYSGNVIPQTNMEKLKKLTIPLNTREL
ncbi:GTP pyrophosphokinase family protein [Anaerosacchariphilus sp. NSJ-68]|uniref:GTP pyrophosphokinase family protein n=3 Tax=Lachnospirales TaxID=3085636 RepID=A0A923RN31_9FIRM|nr:GTP pyrophosphokinase family protein [Anaerosacchariphilus hominis]MBC5699201.1 GTP pyrophosphokinase family protein [Roseburia difficilis]